MGNKVSTRPTERMGHHSRAGEVLTEVDEALERGLEGQTEGRRGPSVSPALSPPPRQARRSNRKSEGQGRAFQAVGTAYAKISRHERSGLGSGVTGGGCDQRLHGQVKPG